MAIKRLEDQLEVLEKQIIEAQLDPSISNLGLVRAEFNKLKFMLEGLSSYTEHRWQVKLFSNTGNVTSFDLRWADNLESAVEAAHNLCDEFDDVVRYELYCDGRFIPEEG